MNGRITEPLLGDVDDVHEVESVDPDDVDESAASGATRGVVRRDDRFVVWVDPDALV